MVGRMPEKRKCTFIVDLVYYDIMIQNKRCGRAFHYPIMIQNQRQLEGRNELKNTHIS